jgi:PAS domain S-box-containing protein
MDFVSLFAPDEQTFLEQKDTGSILKNKAQEGCWFIRKDGSTFFGELHSSALRNEKGEQYAIIAQLRDVTERKHSQEALREERQRFLDLFENSPIPTWLEDFSAVVAWMEELRAKGVTDLRKFLEKYPDEYRVGVSLIRVLDVNNAAVIMNGARNRQELVYAVQEIRLDRTPSSVMIHEFDLIWQGNTSFGFEMSSSKLEGSPVTGILHIYIPVNGSPDYSRVIVTSTDITERVEMEKKLRASELHYRELADSITDVVFELDHDLRYTHWNKASEILMDITANDAIGRSMYEIFGESEEQARIGRIYTSVLDEARVKTFETEILMHGQKLVFEINASPSTHGVSVVARNITERKLSETLMQKRFELVEYAAHHSFKDVVQKTIDDASELTGSHLGFLHFIEEDETTTLLQAWSTETRRNFCRTEGQGMHYPVEEAGVWADAVRKRHPVIHNDYGSLLDQKGTPDGHARVIREMVIPIIRNEKIVAVIGVGNKDKQYTRQDIEMAERFADYAWDITERKQMESALAEERNQLAKRVEERTADLSRANSNLARALRVKDEFLANMSHELRTPLNAILGLSESLGEQVAGPLNEKQQKYLSTINESGHHLLALINDILDLAKIEAGQITLDINKVDVNSVCQASLRMIKQLAQKKNQEVIFEIDSDLGLMWADERRLKQMIVNLLSNAVKFTPEYSRIGLEVRGERAANKVMITVWDTGIGIKEDDLQRLFMPFVQLDSGLAREATGTGLGLALVAQMARLHGGSVYAQSNPGEGSRFIIQLPWEPAMASDMVARLRNTGKFRAIDPNGHRPTILLIEDTEEVVMMLVDYLEMAGYKIVTAQDGVDGLEQAKLTRPDLILMDIQMPRMDGFETTQKLRNDPQFRNIPIIALTALAMPNDRQRCLDAGMDDYISKPVNLKALTKTIQKLLSLGSEPS